MSSSPETLSSWEASCLEREFRIAWTLLPMSIVLVWGWTAVDWLLEPTLWLDYFFWRTLNAAVMGMIVLFVHRLTTLKRVRIALVAAHFVTAATVAMLVPRSEHYAIYVLGFSLIPWSAGFLVTSSLRTLVTVQASIAGAFIAAHLILPVQDTKMAVGATMYILCAAVLSVVSGSISFRLQRETFEARLSVDQKNEELQSTLVVLEQTGRELEHSKAALEDQVAARTNELMASLTRVEQESAERLLAQDLARAASSAKSAFLANMSHELRTPLNAIVGYSELVAEELRDLRRDDLITDMKRVTDSAKHLLTIIDDVLDLSRVEAGELRMDFQEVSLNAVASEVVEWLTPTSKGPIRLQLADESMLTWGDAIRLRQVLGNLVGNAIKFGERGPIHVETHRLPDHRLEVSVTDHGAGIPPDELDHVFQRFRQVDETSTRKHGGVGLGLAICRELMAAMNGELTVESRLGSGSTFRLVCPAHIKVEAASPSP